MNLIIGGEIKYRVDRDFFDRSEIGSIIAFTEEFTRENFK